MLGIIGGMGAHAGLNLFSDVLNHTEVSKDSDHLPLMLWSTPHRVSDRSAFLVGDVMENPAFIAAEMAVEMYKLGVSIIGVPCNTFHAKPIWSIFLKEIKSRGCSNLKIISIIESTKMAVVEKFANQTLGILGTIGTYQQGFYSNAFDEINVSNIAPNDEDKKKVHDTIYNKIYGLKTFGYLTERAAGILKQVIDNLRNAGATALVVGCTEFSLIPLDFFPKDMPIIDPSVNLAKAMISSYQQK